MSRTGKETKKHRQHRRRHPAWHYTRHTLLRIGYGVLITLGVAGLIVLATVLYYNGQLPATSELLALNATASTKIYARDGTLLYEVYNETRRTPVALDQIANDLKNATIAVEDKNFYQHGALSIRSIFRSLIANYESGSASQGGSTITQQFVKNALLNRNKLFSRKIQEMLLAVKIEALYPKDQILELYLNEIPYGRNAYGAEAAANAYFGKSAKNLTLAQSAYLAALPQAPTFYSPTGANRKLLDERKNYVLRLMSEQGYIDQEQYEKALAEIVEFKASKIVIIAPHFVEWIQSYLTDKYGKEVLEQGGLKVYTTLDPRLQKLAEQAVAEGVAINEKKYNGSNAGLVAIDPKTGQVLAMVGSRDYFDTPQPAGCSPGRNCRFEPNVNVTTANLQVGSSFKPYVYVTAFQREFGYAPASAILDGPANYNGYTPRNYSGGYYGWIPMRRALAGSLNTAAVRTLYLIGEDSVIKTAHNLGITAPLKGCGLPLALGACEVKLVDHVAAFGGLANGGAANGSTGILTVLTKNNELLEEYRPKNIQVLDPQAVYEVVNIMTDNDARKFVFGAKSPLVLPDRPVAAKTGTTQDWKSGLTIGFTPSLVAGVWVGNNNGDLLAPGADGVFVAAPIWNKFMTNALAGTPPEYFTAPAGIIPVRPRDVPATLRNKYIFGGASDIFADYAVPRLTPKVNKPPVTNP